MTEKLRVGQNCGWSGDTQNVFFTLVSSFVFMIIPAANVSNIPNKSGGWSNQSDLCSDQLFTLGKK